MAPAPVPHFELVLLHGYGMSGSHMVEMARELSLPGSPLALQGDIELEGGVRAWWPERRLSGNAPAGSLRPDTRLLALAVSRLHDQVQFLVARNRPVVLLGYSQGAAVAIEYASKFGEMLVGVAVVAAPGMSLTALAFNRLPVFLAHGRLDTRVPFEEGCELRYQLAAAGALVRWLPFEGGHTITFHCARALRDFLSDMEQRLVQAGTGNATRR